MGTACNVIGSCLFEPIAIVAGLGLLLLIWNAWHEDGFRIKFLAVAVILAVIWRILYGIVSSRYALSLVLPGLLLSVFVIDQLPTYFPLKHRRGIWWRTGMLTLLAAGLLLKDFRFNPNENNIPKMGRIMAEDAIQFEYPLVFSESKDINRVVYYAGLKPLAYDPVTGAAYKKDSFSTTLNTWKYDCGKVIYIIQSTRRNELELTAEELGVPQDKWSILGRFPIGRREKEKYVLYRYLKPSLPLQSFGALSSRNNRLHNGNFEISGLLGKSQQRFQKLAEANICRFPTLWPENWQIAGVLGYAPDCHAKIGLVPHALNGKYSLQMESDSPIGILCQQEFPVANYRLQFELQGQQENLVGLGGYVFRNQKTRFQIFYYMRLPNDQQHRFNFDLPKNLFGTGAVSFRLCLINVHGKTLWDDIILQPSGAN